MGPEEAARAVEPSALRGTDGILHATCPREQRTGSSCQAPHTFTAQSHPGQGTKGIDSELTLVVRSLAIIREKATCSPTPITSAWLWGNPRHISVGGTAQSPCPALLKCSRPPKPEEVREMPQTKKPTKPGQMELGIWTAF